MFKDKVPNCWMYNIQIKKPLSTVQSTTALHSVMGVEVVGQDFSRNARFQKRLFTSLQEF